CNHARLGATIAQKLGYNERVCWLIAHHEDRETCDPDLLLLQRADNSPSAAPSSRPRTAGTEHRR
ncbi:MAG TPA: hypothetical protein VNZ55_03705, partial [Thermomicrobiales bacterium]|nr:hypothetical protein [Thermomicrobiales bacterium]